MGFFFFARYWNPSILAGLANEQLSNGVKKSRRIATRLEIRSKLTQRVSLFLIAIFSASKIVNESSFRMVLRAVFLPRATKSSKFDHRTSFRRRKMFLPSPIAISRCGGISNKLESRKLYLNWHASPYRTAPGSSARDLAIPD